MTMTAVECILAVALFALGFVGLHASAPLVAKRLAGEKHYDAYRRLSSWKSRMYWRRIVRGQVYYMYVAVASLGLVAYYTSSKEQIYAQWNVVIQTHATVGLAHWIVASVEDGCTWSLLSGDLTHPIAVYSLAFLYGAHHIIAAAAYSYILYTKELSFLAIAGFFFEVPVAIQSVREFAIAFRDAYVDPPSILTMFVIIQGDKRRSDNSKRRVVVYFWISNLLAAFVFRFAPLGMYWWSVFFWRDTIADIPKRSQVTYYALGGVFTLGNVAYLLLLASYARIDYVNMRCSSKNRSCSLSTVRQTPNEETKGTRTTADPDGVSVDMNAPESPRVPA